MFSFLSVTGSGTKNAQRHRQLVTVHKHPN
jgi:hypothetical protein